MGARRSLFWSTGALALACAAWLLWPMPGSPRWDIAPDPALLGGKTAYLASLTEAAPLARPNVLLIVADDLGRHEVGYMGRGPVVTPSIDALARSGTAYPNAYATAAICAPSRAALLTGRIQNRFGFESQPMQRYVRNRGEYLAFRYLIDTSAMQPLLIEAYPREAQRAAQGLPPSEISLAEIFRAVGYRTGIFGKWHLGYSAANHPHRFGFDEQYGFMEAFTLYAARSAPDIVEHHHDLFWEEHIWDMGRSGPSAITRNGRPVPELRYLTDAIVAETRAFIDAALASKRPFFAYVPFSAPHTPFQARLADYQALEEIGDHNQRVYLAMLRRLDWAVGALVSHLAAREVLDDTVVVFTSDNGGADYTGATSNAPLRGGKFTQFEGGLAVPLIVRSPGIQTGRDARIVLLTDLFATFMDHLGLPLPEDRGYDAVSLMGPARDRNLYWRSDFNRAVRAGNWKLLHDRNADRVQLFDLSADPGEHRDLSGAETETARALLDALRTWEAELRPASWPRAMNYRYRDELGESWFAI